MFFCNFSESFHNTTEAVVQVFYKEGIFNNIAKFTGKHLYKSLYSNKVADLKKTLAQVFCCDFAKFLRTPFFMKHLWWLLLTYR